MTRQPPSRRAEGRRRAARRAGAGAAAVVDPALDLATLARVAGYPSASKCARAHGINGARAAGGLSIWVADRLAVACGLLPWEVWGDSWWAACARHEARYQVEGVA